MKIKSILVANRGEIAVRIIKTAKRLGIKTYVIKSRKDANALYLELADDAFEIPENPAFASEFLDIEGIVALAKEKKITAIHPGYGFLAENPGFAKRCKEENIIFIGPSHEVIYNMGQKTIAKKIATASGIPLIPGSEGEVKNVNDAVKVAKKIGYPVIIKAVAGGGGRGMRIVEKASEMEKLFKQASSEAEKAFNNPALFVEKYLYKPRHIEFQVFGDKFGNVIHLGERECSIQRRHQKLLEEAPSIALDEKLRKKMGDTAIKMAKAVKYENAGTVEFLLDKDRKFYFMEMNTRIQVEHPVTEMITHSDLVEMQIRIAEGEKLPYTQSNVDLEGWAIECRINAEDVQSNFSPNTGIIDMLVLPKGTNIRIDTGIQERSAITSDFDSMIAKLIVHGDTRTKAIQNTLKALNQFRIKGLKTTVPFFKAVLNNKAFVKGNISTDFIGKELDDPCYHEPEEEMLAALLATVDYHAEATSYKESNLEHDRRKNISAWVLNKRMKSL
ncbi:MAG: acetyl-CoA carboxylase biotin carboxylase subunit [Bacteroidales bacterium]|nr:acetyl-CoA carboxylase biotin carboxylase subunit [Bacteroidales bacterium]